MIEATGRLRVGVLGPLRLAVDGAPVEVRGAKRRAVLALLAIAEGRIVTVDRLVDALWPAGGRRIGTTGPAQSRVPAARAPGRGGRPAADPGRRLPAGRSTVDELDLAQARRCWSAARASPATRRPPRSADPGASSCGAAVLADLGEFLPVAAAVAQWANAAPRRHRRHDRRRRSRPAGRDEVVAPAIGALAADPLREPAVLLAMRALGGDRPGRRGAAARPGLPAAARRRDRAGPVRLRWTAWSATSPAGAAGSAAAAGRTHRSARRHR